MIGELNGDFLQWLRGFYAIAKTGSIRKAAVLMNRNPSTLSYQLNSLEKELNTVLFERSKQGLKITREGQCLVEWTITIFENLCSMRAEVGTPCETFQGNITISSNMSIGTRSMPAICAFQKKHPRVTVQIRKKGSVAVLDDVASARVDFGMVGVIKPPEGHIFHEVFFARPLLIVPMENNYNLPEYPTEEDLKTLPYVYFLSEEMDESDDFLWKHPMFSSCKRNLVLGVNNYHLMIGYVSNGIGAAVLDEACFLANIAFPWQNRVRVYPLDWLLPLIKYGILIRKQKHLSPQAQALIKILHSELYCEDSLSICQQDSSKVESFEKIRYQTDVFPFLSEKD